MNKLLKIASVIGSDYYPEILGQMYIVNAPYLFTGVWSIVKGFLDERTVAKIRIMSNGHKEVLLEVIDADILPHFLGGNYVFADKDGENLKSDIGPWNKYRMK